MLTEAIHTPFLGDRALALANAQYVMGTARHFGDEIEFKPNGKIEQRAAHVMREAVALLTRVADRGLMESIAGKAFADVSRPPDGGRGFAGVVAKRETYWNPFEDALRPLAPA
jgi:beta-lysine 5,6-aminomutase alpha subunit